MIVTFFLFYKASEWCLFGTGMWYSYNNKGTYFPLSII